jgi:SAM-dependent methyltransferase
MLREDGVFFEQNFDNSHFPYSNFCNPATIIAKYFGSPASIAMQTRWGPVRLWRLPPHPKREKPHFKVPRKQWSGFSVQVHDGNFYAVPTSMGAADLSARAVRHHPAILSAHSEEELQGRLEATEATTIVPAEPQIVEKGYKGFDIYRCNGVHIACDPTQGAPDLALIRHNRFGRWISGESLKDVTRLIDRLLGVTDDWDSRVLFICDTTPGRVREILGHLPFRDVTLLVSSAHPQQWPPYPSVDLAGRGSSILDDLKAQGFDLVIVPYENKLDGESWEKHVAGFAPQLLAAFPDGALRLYRGNHLTRLVYNAAYLRSMLRLIPSLEGVRALEIGCSDGLTCDALAHLGAAEVVGIDPIGSVGLLYPDRNVTYHQMRAERLAFEDRSFDLCYSIATLEHLQDPLRSLTEMARVTRPGGLCYIQAGPLYYSPFGHHMFGYFDDCPWIHLRHSRDEIVALCRRYGVEERIQHEKGTNAEGYVQAMISTRHVNGRLLREYGLEEFAQSGRVEVLHFGVSREGEDLLTGEILTELEPLTKDDLTTHGFELVFRVR